MFKQLVLVSSLLASSCVFAEIKDEWFDIYKTDKVEHQINAAHIDNIDVNNKTFKFWEKQIYLKSDGVIKVGTFGMMELAVKCKKKQYAIIQTSVYNKNYEVVGEHKPDQIVWKDWIPDSIISNELRDMCAVLFHETGS